MDEDHKRAGVRIGGLLMVALLTAGRHCGKVSRVALDTVADAKVADDLLGASDILANTHHYSDDALRAFNRPSTYLDEIFRLRNDGPLSLAARRQLLNEPKLQIQTSTADEAKNSSDDASKAATASSQRWTKLENHLSFAQKIGTELSKSEDVIVRDPYLISLLPTDSKTYSAIYKMPTTSAIESQLKRLRSNLALDGRVGTFVPTDDEVSGLLRTIDSHPEANPLVFVGHSEFEGRILILPNGQRLSAETLHRECAKRGRQCFLITCHSESVGISGEISALDAHEMWRYAVRRFESRKHGTTIDTFLEDMIIARTRQDSGRTIVISASITVLGGALILESHPNHLRGPNEKLLFKRKAIRHLRARGHDPKDIDAFFVAVHTGDTALVDLFIAAGVPLAATSSLDKTALTTAIEAGHTEIVFSLITNGVDVNQKGRSWPATAIETIIIQETIFKQKRRMALWLLLRAGALLEIDQREQLLRICAGRNYPESIEILLRDRHDEATVDRLLALASEQGHLEIVRILLDVRKAAGYKTHLSNIIALGLALENGHRLVVSELYKAGVPQLDRASLKRATSECYPEIAKEYLESDPSLEELEDIILEIVSRSDQNCISIAQSLLRIAPTADLKDRALQRAIDSNQRHMISMLLREGADIKRIPALFGFNNRDEFRFLLEAGADVNYRDHRGRTPLIKWACLSDIDSVKLLIGFGANVDAVDNEGNSALLCSAGRGDASIVNILIESRANPDLQDQSGQTALMIAARTGRSDLVEILLSAGANPGIRDSRNKSAVRYAFESSHFNIVNKIRTAHAKH